MDDQDPNRPPPDTAEPDSARNGLSWTLLAFGGLAFHVFLVWLAESAVDRGPSRTDLVAGTIWIALTGGLAWRRPSPRVYALGVICVIFGFSAFWLQTPAGLDWLQLEDEAVRLRAALAEGLSGELSTAIMLLIPVGWVLLAHSVGHLRIGLATYLAPAVLGFMLILVLTGARVGLELALLWPLLVLVGHLA